MLTLRGLNKTKTSNAADFIKDRIGLPRGAVVPQVLLLLLLLLPGLVVFRGAGAPFSPEPAHAEAAAGARPLLLGGRRGRRGAGVARGGAVGTWEAHLETH